MTGHAAARAVLLDMDGTLLDTAPDMARALNRLRAEHGKDLVGLDSVRRWVSHGSNAVVRVGFPEADACEFDRLRARFLELYREHLALDTRLFDGFPELLERLEANSVPWGIVTNKPGWLAEPLLRELDLLDRSACLIAGDSLPARKPDPLPLLTAAERVGVPPRRCLYLGDALRDAQAAQAAGMLALGATFGYIDPDENLVCWPVDGWIGSPLELLGWVELATASAEPSSGSR